MPVQSVENKSDSRTESVKMTATGMVHRFKSPTEFISVKISEIGSNRSQLLKVLNNPGLVIEEGCNSRLCGAPPSAHHLARTA